MADKIELSKIEHGNGVSVILTLNPKNTSQFSTSISDTFKSKEEADTFIKEFARGLNKVLKELAAEERKAMAKDLLKAMKV